MRMNELLEIKSKELLNIYFTAGYPNINSLPIILNSLEKSGADLVEIGIPYSDPLSDGPTIQESSKIALENGMNIELLFDQLSQNECNIPVYLMGYFNSVYKFGIEAFCKKCHETKVAGLILPDLPFDIYKSQYESLFKKYDLSLVFLITPETSEERIRKFDDHSSSFIYAVSSSSTTGKGKNIFDAEKYLQRIQALNLKNPVLVGFNISQRSHIEFVSKYTNGGIIGSAFIRHISNSKDLPKSIEEFVKNIKEK